METLLSATAPRVLFPCMERDKLFAISPTETRWPDAEKPRTGEERWESICAIKAVEGAEMNRKKPALLGQGGAGRAVFLHAAVFPGSAPLPT